MKLSKRTQSLKPSSVFVLLQKVEDLRKQGYDIINLSVGEPEWDTYSSIKVAGKKAIDEGYSKYTPSEGRGELRARISEYSSRSLGLSFSPEEVVVSAGCKYALYSLFQCLCEEGDEVILPTPYWVSYLDVIKLSGATCKLVPTEESTGFKITPDQLQNSITKKTKVFLLNSPNNPTSAIYSSEELKALGEVLRKHPDLIIITDDIYDRMVFEGTRSPHLLSICPDLRNRTFCANGASKNFLMTGWRLGWILGPKEVIKTLSAFHSQSISCAHSITQRAFEESFLSCEKDIQNMVQKLRGLRQVIFEGFSRIEGVKPYPSEGAFYLWAKVKGLLGRSHQGSLLSSSAVLQEQLFEKAGLVCLGGEKFGAPGHLRFSYSVEKKHVEEAVSRFSGFVSELT